MPPSPLEMENKICTLMQHIFGKHKTPCTKPPRLGKLKENHMG